MRPPPDTLWPSHGADRSVAPFEVTLHALPCHGLSFANLLRCHWRIKKVREERKDKAQRIADAAPKAMRAQMRESAMELAVQ